MQGHFNTENLAKYNLLYYIFSANLAAYFGKPINF